MAWLAALTFGVVSLGTGWFVYTLVSNLEPMPEYPTIMVDTMRLIGALIAVAGATFGLILTGYGLVGYANEYVFV